MLIIHNYYHSTKEDYNHKFFLVVVVRVQVKYLDEHFFQNKCTKLGKCTHAVPDIDQELSTETVCLSCLRPSNYFYRYFFNNAGLA